MKTIILASLITAVTLTSLTGCFFGPRGGSGWGMDRGFSRMTDDLDLTTVQKTKLDELKTAMTVSREDSPKDDSRTEMLALRLVK